MIGSKFTLTYHIPGTLAANVSMYFTAQADCQLIHVSANGSNANNGLLDIGPSTDTDGYLDGVDIGDSNTPAEFDSSSTLWVVSSPTSSKGPSLPSALTTTVLVVQPPMTLLWCSPSPRGNHGQEDCYGCASTG